MTSACILTMQDLNIIGNSHVMGEVNLNSGKVPTNFNDVENLSKGCQKLVNCFFKHGNIFSQGMNSVKLSSAQPSLHFDCFPVIVLHGFSMVHLAEFS